MPEPSAHRVAVSVAGLSASHGALTPTDIGINYPTRVEGPSFHDRFRGRVLSIAWASVLMQPRVVRQVRLTRAESQGEIHDRYVDLERRAGGCYRQPPT